MGATDSILLADLVARLGRPAAQKERCSYTYFSARGVATLNRGDDRPLVQLGAFSCEVKARAACEKHFQLVCRGLRNLGKQVPEVHYA